jgi:hypothetical protein
VSENRVDSVRISREGQLGRPAGVAPSWIPPVLKRFYDFTKKWAGTFGNELKDNEDGKKEEELIKAVAKSFKDQI